ncbi:MAG: alpha/beta hydrolase [Parvibaculaceae bacterium]
MDDAGLKDAAAGRAARAFTLARRTPSDAAFDWLLEEPRVLRRRYESVNRVEDRGRFEQAVLEAAGRKLKLLVQHPQERTDQGRAIIYFHGGGWIVGSPWTHADVSRLVCEAAGMTLVSVDYRLAPEAVAPAPVEDGLLVLRQMLSEGVGGIKPAGVVLCGDSAGGAIALAAERGADPNLRKAIAGVASLYGAFGLMDSPSLVKASREDGMVRDCLERYWALANPAQDPSPYALEALTVPSSVPAYLLAASEDPVLDDTLAIAAAFEKAGRPHKLHVVEGEGHGFFHGPSSQATTIEAAGRLGAWMASR